MIDIYTLILQTIFKMLFLIATKASVFIAVFCPIVIVLFAIYFTCVYPMFWSLNKFYYDNPAFSYGCYLKERFPKFSKLVKIVLVKDFGDDDLLKSKSKIYYSVLIIVALFCLPSVFYDLTDLHKVASMLK